MADRIWLKNYPAGIPADIDPDRFKSLADLFDHIVDKFADKPALQKPWLHNELRRSGAPFSATSQRTCKGCRAWPKASASPSCRPICCSTR